MNKKQDRKKYETSVINKSKVKEKATGFKVTSDYLDKLERKVEKIIRESKIRASGNRRSTLMARDL